MLRQVQNASMRRDALSGICQMGGKGRLGEIAGLEKNVGPSCVQLDAGCRTWQALCEKLKVPIAVMSSLETVTLANCPTPTHWLSFKITSTFSAEIKTALVAAEF